MAFEGSGASVEVLFEEGRDQWAVGGLRLVVDDSPVALVEQDVFEGVGGVPVTAQSPQPLALELHVTDETPRDALAQVQTTGVVPVGCFVPHPNAPILAVTCRTTTTQGLS